MSRSRPVELTDDEVQCLLETLLKGKVVVSEDDCLTLVRWANEQRTRAMLVDLMLASEVRPVVRDGEVLVEAI